MNKFITWLSEHKLAGKAENSFCWDIDEAYLVVTYEDKEHHFNIPKQLLIGYMIEYLFQNNIKINTSTIRHFDHLYKYLENKIKKVCIGL